MQGQPHMIAVDGCTNDDIVSVCWIKALIGPSKLDEYKVYCEGCWCWCSLWLGKQSSIYRKEASHLNGSWRPAPLKTDTDHTLNWNTNVFVSTPQGNVPKGIHRKLLGRSASKKNELGSFLILRLNWVLGERPRMAFQLLFQAQIFTRWFSVSPSAADNSDLPRASFLSTWIA